MDDLDVCSDKVHMLYTAVTNADRVCGYTHNFYRYPARFSPVFAKSVIETFSVSGDTILDPFVGGGTTAIEALAAGRRFIGVDINPVAVFVSSVKARALSERKLRLAREVADRVVAQRPQVRGSALATRHDSRFLNAPWWIRGIVHRLMVDLSATADGEVLAFLRCALLKTAQWAMDCRSRIPTSAQFLSAFHSNALQMASQMDEYRLRLRPVAGAGCRAVADRLLLLTRSAVGLEEDSRIPSGWTPVKLVVTSPPYPGVHVLYHRWQVRGRRETPAPFAIVNVPDGHGASYFTLGSRQGAGLRAYFDTLTACFSSVARLLRRDALVVQMVSFADPESQKPQFLAAMQVAGFEECGLGSEEGSEGLWRSVPNRKWYAHAQDNIASSKEIVLLHRLRREEKPAPPASRG